MRRRGLPLSNGDVFARSWFAWLDKRTASRSELLCQKGTHSGPTKTVGISYVARSKTEWAKTTLYGTLRPSFLALLRDAGLCRLMYRLFAATALVFEDAPAALRKILAGARTLQQLFGGRDLEGQVV
jgi:hypothetical protein